MANPNISQIITTTLESQVPKIIDNVTNNHPLLSQLKAKGNLKKLSGGNAIRESLSYAENSTVQSQGEYDTFDTTPQDVLTSADFDFKIITGTTTMTGLEIKQNAGKERIIDLLKGKFQVLEASMKNEIGSQIYGDGTGNGSQDIGGLQLLVADDPTNGTVGGINRANYTFWRNQLWNFTTESVTASATTIQNAMNQLSLRTQVQAGEMTDMIAADSIYFSYYQDSLQTIQRITDPSKGSLGFKSLDYQGAVVFYDPECPASHMYFLNTDHIFLKYLGKNFFEAQETTRPVNQDVFVTPLIFTGNMTTTNSRTQGVMVA
jgi:hypothetical protein